MKRLLLLAPFFFILHSAFAQGFTNSWIHYNQEYYKIKVAQDGIYRIDRNTLLNAGFSATTADPRKIQLFRNGQEVPIYVEGENDGVFDNGDFIEFYGQHNDGSFDTPMYGDPTYQPNLEYSLFNDTSVYFLTYNPLANGSRLTVTTDNNYSSYTTASYFIRPVFVPGKSVIPDFFFGYNRGMDDQSIEYTMSEGWGAVFGNFAAGNYPITFPVTTDKVYAAGPDVEMNFVIGGVNNPQHNTSITYGSTVYNDTAYYGQMLRRIHLTTPASTFTSATTNFVFNSTTANPASNPDYSMMYNFYVIYPHTYDMEGSTSFLFKVPDDGSQAFTRADFTNFNGGTTPILYDLTNNKRILITPNGATYQALIGNDGSATPKTCYLTNSVNILTPTVTQINYVSNNAGHFNDVLGMQTDSAFIIITHRSLWSEANSYKNYRNTTTGGHALIFDIDELYDQFAYGIAKHPLSVKNFANYILSNWTTAPAQHIFLIGKSVSPADYRTSTAYYAMNTVSSYGVPSSDMLLTSGINGAVWEPAIPIGRLSAQNGQTVLDYLQKVQEYETAQAGTPQPWMKEILHFGGGDDQAQQDLLAGYLDNYKSILEDSLFGGRVTTYLKFTNDPIQINLSDTLQAQIDSGVAIMTFFGHASGSSFDASTDEPSAYHNQGRYPLIVANSCFAGDFHSTVKSLSEKFVMEPEKAAIAFLASVGQGQAPYLFDYTSAFYNHASHDMYGATIGQLMKGAIQSIQPMGDAAHKIVSNEMSLQGDPSLRLNNFLKPDYSIEESGISFTPGEVTTDLDTFALQIITRNFGKAIQDSFVVKVTRTYPDGSDSVFTFLRGHCYYADTLNMTVHTGGFSSAGVNKIKVEVDMPDSVDEYDNYFNNTASTDFFIFSKDIIPVYPPKFAIYPYNTVTLKANTANPFTGLNNYVFQIDTIDPQIVDSVPGMQHSPLFRFTTVSDSGGVISWSPQNYQLLDSVVYFWRVANDSINIDPTKYSWQESSFQYIPGKSGWGQSHFFQFKEDDLENINMDTIPREFSFVYNLKSLKVTTIGSPNASTFKNVGYFLNNSPVEYDGCQVWPAIMVAVLDSISLQPWTTCDYSVQQANVFHPQVAGTCNYGQVYDQNGVGCGHTRSENYFIFRYNDTYQMNGFQNFLNSVPNNDYIIMYSWFTTAYSSTAGNAQLFSTLASLGINTGGLQDNTSFIYFLKKGDPSTIAEVHGPNDSTEINLHGTMASHWNRGNYISTMIGPSTRWESLHWNQHPKEGTPTRDEYHMEILGLNSATDTWDQLASNIQYSTGKDTSLSWINATTYPYLKLKMFNEDDSLYTPSQMNYWRVYHDEVPEAALNPNYNYSLYSGEISEGDTLHFSVGIENISNLPMDSLGVKFYMYDKNRNRHNLSVLKLDSLRANRSLIASMTIDTTLGLAGENSLWVEVNPFDTLHQIEKYHFNNLGEVKFKVNRDNINPILDVTFDAIHILNGDIVSGKPLITIQLHDENKFLALNDTSKFKVYLRKPGSSTNELISFQTPAYGAAMRFTPAVLPKNSCRIDWEPTLTDDGTYTLEVEATDRSNNESGKYNYKIQFEVVNKSSITEVLNYPNPFSTSTRFVFTLTGNEIPTHMKIQIMTVSGKIVREIMLNELGNVHVGRNITDYAWDGKDEFGDQLANGVYLYRVITDLNGENIEHRETDIDKYFKRGWGKMYLMR